MNIYPYVYRLDHPVTGEFYIGFRCANKVPSTDDLGKKYFTSSKHVKPRFHEFHYQIIAEFFNKTDAYDFEQLMIHESIGNKLMLNRICHHQKPRFTMTGKHHTSEYHHKPKSNDTRLKMSKARKIYWETASRDNIINSNTNRIYSTESKNKMSNSAKNRVSDEFKDAASKRMSVLVCRLSDKKVMNIGNFYRYLD